MRYTVTVLDRTIEVEVNGESVLVDGRRHQAQLMSIPGTPLRHLVLDSRSTVLAVTPDAGSWIVQTGGERCRARVVDERTRRLRELTGPRYAREGAGTIRAPMPGLVLRLEVTAGERVDAGKGMLVLEAMKMENEITASVAGVVTKIHVREGQAVEKGAPLVDLTAPPVDPGAVSG